MIEQFTTPYYVAPIYYLPLQYAVSQLNSGRSEEDALQSAIDRFAYYGKRNGKRLKAFDINQFTKHFHRFISTPHAVIVRKSPKHTL